MMMMGEVFHGKVELIQESFQKEQIDFNGMLQKVLVFPLKIIAISSSSITFKASIKYLGLKSISILWMP